MRQRCLGNSSVNFIAESTSQMPSWCGEILREKKVGTCSSCNTTISPGCLLASTASTIIKCSRFAIASSNSMPQVPPSMMSKCGCISGRFSSSCTTRTPTPSSLNKILPTPRINGFITTPSLRSLRRFLY